MSDRILVTYCTHTGSTAGVAQTIGETLVEKGLPVDVRPMHDVADLTPYRAVVAGSAIQAGQWLPEAIDFVQTHQASLKQKPFAAFLVCMTLAMKNATGREIVPQWLAPVRALVKPVSEGYFAGILDIAHAPSFRQRLMFRLSVLFGVWSQGDHRDWQAIRTWADGLNV